MESNSFVPSKVALVKGVGRHSEKLSSFEMALRQAGIAHLNLVRVSSILPPRCKIVPAKTGLKELQPGQITFAVLSQAETNEAHRLIAASVGLAIPKDPDHHGYLSEHHAYGERDEEAGDYAEDLAAEMLATILGVEFDPETNWNEKEEIWKISGLIVRTSNITQSAIGRKGIWTTVISGAALIP